MKRFDRVILISLSIGVWALVMTQIYKPVTASALSSELSQAVKINGTVETKCSITDWTKVTCFSATVE